MGHFKPPSAQPLYHLVRPSLSFYAFPSLPPSRSEEMQVVEPLEPDIWALVLASLLLSWMAFIISLNFPMLVVPSEKWA